MTKTISQHLPVKVEDYEIGCCDGVHEIPMALLEIMRRNSQALDGVTNRDTY